MVVTWLVRKGNFSVGAGSWWGGELLWMLARERGFGCLRVSSEVYGMRMEV